MEGVRYAEQLVWSPAGTMLAVREQRRVHVWRVTGLDATPIALPAFEAAPRTLALAFGDGDELLVLVMQDLRRARVHVLRVAEDEATLVGSSPWLEVEARHEFEHGAFGPGATARSYRVALAGDGRKRRTWARVWETTPAESWRPLFATVLSSPIIAAVRLSSCAVAVQTTTFARSGDADDFYHTVHVFDVATGAHRFTVANPEGDRLFEDFLWASDGSALVVLDRQVRVLDAATGEPLPLPPMPPVRALASWAGGGFAALHNNASVLSCVTVRDGQVTSRASRVDASPLSRVLAAVAPAGNVVAISEIFMDAVHTFRTRLESV